MPRGRDCPGISFPVCFEPGLEPADTQTCPPSLSLPEGTGRETLPGGTAVFTGPGHRIGTDALLLADFTAPGDSRKTTPRADISACDLGAGCGILILSLLDRGLAGRAVGLEIDPTGAALLEEAARENGFSRLEAIHTDFRSWRTSRPFDIVVANPPYFRAGPLPPDPVRAGARHEQHGTLPELCAAARRLLKDRGRFCLCYPPARLADLFCALREEGLEPKRLQLVRKAPGAAPWLALVEARKAGGVELAVLPERILPPGQPIAY